MSELTLGDIDRDDAIAEALDALHGTHARGVPAPRRARQRGAAGGLRRARSRRGSSGRDEAILNYALTLEYVQDSFYSEVERHRRAHGRARRAGAGRRRPRARAREGAPRGAWLARAVKRPRFDFRGATEDAERFRKTAVAFEDLAVAAYKGQAPLIQSRALPRPGAGDPLRRGAPRRLDPAPGRASRPPRTRSTSRARTQQHARDRRRHALRGVDPQPPASRGSRGEAPPAARAYGGSAARSSSPWACRSALTLLERGAPDPPARPVAGTAAPRGCPPTPRGRVRRSGRRSRERHRSARDDVGRGARATSSPARARRGRRRAVGPLAARHAGGDDDHRAAARAPPRRPRRPVGPRPAAGAAQRHDADGSRAPRSAPTGRCARG